MKSIRQRRHKVSVDGFGGVLPPGSGVSDVVGAMPRFLAADGLRRLAEAIRAARDAGAPVVIAMGGHVVKTGCSPYIIDLMSRGVVTHVAMNGAAAIHDAEIAMHGETSEDVDDTLGSGDFGMVSETMELFDAAARASEPWGSGLGEGLTRELERRRAPRAGHSLLCAVDAGRATVHAAIGADTVHLSPNLDGAALGKALQADFRAACAVVSQLGAGVWVNLGSATLLPEVFLKAVSAAIRGGADLGGMTTADMDMIRHYRPTQNVVRRPPGRGIQLTGHHEVMVPILHQLLI